MSDCINLMERFGKRYRITFDEAYEAKGKHKATLDPWMMLIPCRGGTIGPQGGDVLRIDLEGHRKTAAQLGRLPGVSFYCKGDVESTLLFHVDQFAAVARIARPKRRRKGRPMTEADKAALAATGKAALATHRAQKRRLKTPPATLFD